MLALTLCATSMWFVPIGRAATGLPAGFQDVPVVSGLTNATAMQFAPDGRLFIAQQGGQLRVFRNGALLPTPFVSLTVSSVGERGLLGVAFDPNFATNQYVYVFYTATTPTIHNRISRFTANGDVASTAAGEVVLLDFDTLGSATNHNGGAMHFGVDGKLYAAHGDNATGSNSQTLGNLLGKIIRMNPLPDPVAQIPADNPFVSTATGKNRLIWTLGLRNPFTFSIDRSSGLTFVNDVGQGTWEEVNDARAGRNFGWPTTEGPFTASSFPQFTNPTYAYRHSGGTPTGCAITGGTFYDPAVPTFPASYIGKYFFADFCGNWIYYLDPANPATPTSFAAAVSGPVDLKVGPDGGLYYLARGTGSVGKIIPTAGTSPQITQHPAAQTVGIGGTATFTVAATGSQPLTYQWQRNGVDIPGATAASYTTPPATLGDHNSSFRCRVGNTAGTVTSDAATLTVLNNATPTASIITPVTGARYSAGSAIVFSGSGVDAEDGTLPASQLSWRIDFHHDTHVHPGMPATSGVSSGSFVVPDAGETATNVWHRVYLTVTDTAGLSATSFVDVLPNVATLTITTSPPGLTVMVDGQPLAAPAALNSVVGMVRTLGVVTPQIVGGQTYRFLNWSDGGAASHDVRTPAAATTWLATYTNLLPGPTGLRIVR